MKDMREKLDAICSGTSNWMKNAEWRIANREQLHITANHAFRILRILRIRGISKEVMAQQLDIPLERFNKIVTGGVILTPEEITKLEGVR